MFHTCWRGIPSSTAIAVTPKAIRRNVFEKEYRPVCSGPPAITVLSGCHEASKPKGAGINHIRNEQENCSLAVSVCVGVGGGGGQSNNVMYVSIRFATELGVVARRWARDLCRPHHHTDRLGLKTASLARATSVWPLHSDDSDKQCAKKDRCGNQPQSKVGSNGDAHHNAVNNWREAQAHSWSQSTHPVYHVKCADRCRPCEKCTRPGFEPGSPQAGDWVCCHSTPPPFFTKPSCWILFFNKK